MAYYSAKLQMRPVMKACLFFVTVFFLTSLSQAGFAHPHAQADCKLALTFDDKGLAGFRVRIAFDGIYSDIHLQEITQAISEESETPLSEHEIIERFRKEIFEEFKDFNFFTHVLIEGKEFAVDNVQEFLATADQEDRLICSFFVPCRVATGSQPRHIVISVFDESYYRDMSLLADGISIEGGKHLTIDYKVEKMENLKFSYQDKVLVPNGVLLILGARISK
jgi:ABC-type uncharacterized transport system substrate-binding protein